MAYRRNRLAYSLIIAIVIAIGMLSRSSFAVHLPLFLATYAGDTLWSLALFLTLCVLLPGTHTALVALLTIGLSFSVEISQLYQAPWINTIRATRIGSLVLGVGFKGSDLPCYTVGCLMGVAGDVLASHKNKNTDPNNLQERVGTKAPNPQH